MMEYTAYTSRRNVIGHRGENRCMAILIPVPDDLLDHNVKIFYRLPSSSAPIEIPETSFTREGNFIRWIITSAETERSGEGQFQVRFTRGRQTVKSPVYQTVVLKSIDDD